MTVKRVMLVVALAGALTAMAGNPPPWAPEETCLRARLDLRVLRQSPVYQNWVLEHPEIFEEAAFRLSERTGVRLDQVEEVWLTAVDKGQGAIALAGDFDPCLVAEKILEMEGSALVEREDCLFAARFPSHNDPYDMKLGVILSGRLLLAGDPGSVNRCVAAWNANAASGGDSYQGLTAAEPGALAELELLRMPASALAKKPFCRAVNTAAAKITLESGGGLRAEASVSVRDEQTAAALEQFLNSAIALKLIAAAGENSAAGTAQQTLLRSVTLKRQGGEVTATAAVSVNEQENLLAAREWRR